MRRYIAAGDIQERYHCDVAVVGGGVAGLAMALSLPAAMKVAVFAKAPLSETSTYKAQGGISIPVGEDDSPAIHAADTIRVGDGLCREEAVAVLTGEAPEALAFLTAMGAQFDRDDGRLSLTREGGHSRRRVVHYKDYTGRHIAQVLRMAAEARENIRFWDGTFVTDLITCGDGCCGCLVWRDGRLAAVYARAVVLATGSYGRLYRRSTNSPVCTGDGVAMAYRAGAVLTDMEFVQFHPTAFTTRDGQVFLLTEALRGEGAYLINTRGERFVHRYHPDGEVAPRDVVSRAILLEMQATGTDFVYLDARHLGEDYLSRRFQQVATKLSENGYNIGRDMIPVAPAQHYCMGGIATDLWGRSSLRGLYACGETACTGVHGANRMASNSLLEGVVFGRRVAQDIAGRDLPPVADGREDAPPRFAGTAVVDRDWLGKVFDRTVGAIRSGEDMQRVQAEVRQVLHHLETAVLSEPHAWEDYNLVQVADAVLTGAIMRQESRGAHFRRDFPARDDGNWQKHIWQQMGKDVWLA